MKYRKKKGGELTNININQSTGSGLLNKTKKYWNQAKTSGEEYWNQAKTSGEEYWNKTKNIWNNTKNIGINSWNKTKNYASNMWNKMKNSSQTIKTGGKSKKYKKLLISNK